MHIRIGKTETKALEDSGSVCTIINRSLPNAVVLNSQESFWVQSPENHDLKTFSNELIKTIGENNTSVKCNDWAAVNFNVTVVEDLFPQIGFLLTRLNKSQMLIKTNV